LELPDMMEEPLIAFKGMDLYEKSLSTLSKDLHVKIDQKRTSLVAVYAYDFIEPIEEHFATSLRAREVVLDPHNPFLTLVRFKHYWDEKTKLSALKIASPRAIKAIYTLDPQPMYLGHLNATISGEVSRLAHEVKLFWDMRQAYQAAEQAIAANHFNLMRNFGVESNIERMTDYAHFLRIWNRDYYLWKSQVTSLLDLLAYQEPV
jgi:hypothetical protein